jgi:uncharacterized membrane protein
MYRLWYALRHRLAHSLRQMRTNILAGFLLLLPIFASILKVVLIEFPEKGSYCLAFVTTRENREISTKTGEKMVGVFLPKVPNPTAGFLIFVPESKLVEVDIGVEAAIKLVVSGGVAAAENRVRAEEPPEEPLTLASLGRLFKPGKRPPHDPRD